MTTMDLHSSFKVLIVKLINQEFGVPISLIRDIFKPTNLTVVPLSSPEIWGVINLRGRIVTAIDLRTLLGLPKRNEDESFMMIALEHENELFSIVVDKVLDVVDLNKNELEPNPSTLEHPLKEVSQGICKLKDDLLCILDLNKILTLTTKNCTQEVAS